MTGKCLVDSISKKFNIVKTSGDEVTIVCPINNCEDKSGHLSLNIQKGVYHCWICDSSGTIREFFDKFGVEYDDILPSETKTFEERIRNLLKNRDKNINGKNIISDKFVQLSYFIEKLLEHDYNSERFGEAIFAISYLSGIGLDYSDIINNYISILKFFKDDIKVHVYGKSYFNSLDKFYGRILIPCFDLEGKVNYWIGRRYLPGIKPRYYNFGESRSNVIWGINRFAKNKCSNLVLCEGVFDAIKNNKCVALLGSLITDEQINIIKVIEPKTITIALDKGEYDKTKLMILKFLENNFSISNIKVIRYRKEDPKDFGQMNRNIIEERINSSTSAYHFLR